MWMFRGKALEALGQTDEARASYEKAGEFADSADKSSCAANIEKQNLLTLEKQKISEN